MSQNAQGSSAPSSNLTLETANSKGNGSNNEDDILLIQHRTRNGGTKEFNISENACRPFGFYYGDRIYTPKGPGTVVGVCENNIWFQLDGEAGCSFWDNMISYEHLLSAGFFKIESGNFLSAGPPPGHDLPPGSHRMKEIFFKGQRTKIVLQNENGPCPLVSTANLLLLKHLIEVKDDIVTGDQLITAVTNYILKVHPQPQNQASPEFEKWKKDMDTLKRTLPSFKEGLDVNIKFNGVDSFEYTDEMIVFKLLNVRMLHGWLVDPQSNMAEVIANNTFNDLQIKISMGNEVMSSGRPTNNEESEKVRHAQIVTQFLNETQTQLTAYGLRQLRDGMVDDEIVVLFRNNHFSTLTRHKGQLYLLVSDVGFDKERNIVWSRIDSVDGASTFHSGDFMEANLSNSVSTGGAPANPLAFLTEHQRHLVSQLTDMGWSTEQCVEAVKNSRSLNLQDAIDYLIAHTQ